MTSVRAAVTLEEPQRQSLMAIVFLAFRTVRQIGIVQLVIGLGFALSRAPSVFYLLVIIPLVGIAFLGFAGLSWWRYTFNVTSGELHVAKGVFSQQTLSVPLDRVQSVSLEQKLLHRPFGLVQVSVETAGTETAEFTIDAVDRPVADALQRAAADHRRREAANVSSTQDAPVGDADEPTEPPAPERPDRVLLRHAPGRVIMIALTQMPLTGFAVIAPLIAFADQGADLIPFDLPSVDEPSLGTWLFWAIPLAAVAILVVSVILNLVRVLLVDWDLTVTSTAAGLRRNSGLLSTTSVASSIPRIQRVQVSQGLLERMANLHTVVLHTIGTGNFVIPGCDPGQVDEIRSIALEGSTGAQPLDRRVSNDEIFKAVRNTSIGVGLLTAALFVPLGWWSLLFLVLVPITWLSTRRQVRLRRWGVSTDDLSDRRAFLGWSQQDVLLRKTNAVRVSQSLFERKRDLATVTVSTADGALSIGMVSIEEARSIRDRALHVAESDPRAWM
ncbi:MAG: PH domain-containing protein [Acidimicrobiia bacterium]|nr:PH domain-containing protein [Acidimicrobiia bacterium]